MIGGRRPAILGEASDSTRIGPVRGTGVRPGGSHWEGRGRRTAQRTPVAPQVCLALPPRLSRWEARRPLSWVPARQGRLSGEHLGEEGSSLSTASGGNLDSDDLGRNRAAAAVTPPRQFRPRASHRRSRSGAAVAPADRGLSIRADEGRRSRADALESARDRPGRDRYPARALPGRPRLPTCVISVGSVGWR